MPKDEGSKSDYALSKLGGVIVNIAKGIGNLLRGRTHKEEGQKPPAVPKPAPPPVKPPPVVPPTPEPVPDGEYIYILHDLLPRNSINGLPETNKVFGKNTAVSPDLLALMKQVMRVANPGITEAQLESGFRKLFRRNGGFCNQKPYGEAGEDFALNDIYCGGASFIPTGVEKVVAGSARAEVYCVDPDDLPMAPRNSVDLFWFLTHGWYFACTAGKNVANPFPVPEFGGRCIVPLCAKGGKTWVYVRNPHVGGPGFIHTNTVLNPFLPARPDITAGILGQ